ncbi:MAG: hypothetical protein CMM90_00860 [Rickettsiales bacterium]|nr:hypothetical protein [Rickettsiales bacterium]|tara:strand:- start:8956 stop:9429 length:474 start_codon:yes stop_codon:yes gene_type:complete
MKKKINGVWFFGLSGSGKTFVSQKLQKKINNSVIVDGDIVRKLISKDLNYSKKDREIQINRIFGISKIIINSGKFPIASSVYLNKKINILCKKNNILVVKINRIKFDTVKKNHKTYRNKRNVVGKDIFYENFKTEVLINDNKSSFFKKLDLKNLNLL